MPITENDLAWVDLHLQSAVYYINMNLRLKELAEWRAKQNGQPVLPPQPLTEPHITPELVHVTPLPARPTIQPMSLKMSITGATHLADSIKAKIQAAKDRMAEATANTNASLVKLNAAADAADQVSASISKEADDLMAQIGQFSNGAPVSE